MIAPLACSRGDDVNVAAFGDGKFHAAANHDGIFLQLVEQSFGVKFGRNALDEAVKNQRVKQRVVTILNLRGEKVQHLEIFFSLAEADNHDLAEKIFPENVAAVLRSDSRLVNQKHSLHHRGIVAGICLPYEIYHEHVEIFSEGLGVELEHFVLIDGGILRGD